MKNIQDQDHHIHENVEDNGLNQTDDKGNVHEKQNPQHEMHTMHHGEHSAQDFLRRFFIVTILLVPLIIFSKYGLSLLHIEEFTFRPYIQLFFASCIFVMSFVFFQYASYEIKEKKYGMMTLVSLALGAGYLFSVASTFFPSLQSEFYLEMSTLVWVLLFGHYLEARSSIAAGNLLQEVARLLPKQAHKIVNGSLVDVNSEDLLKGDQILIRAGEKVPADGIILKGESHFNESHISGESMPIRKGQGERVVAGAICIDGSVQAQLEKVGENSTIGQIQRLITKAHESKPNTQRIADKASYALTFIALTVSICTIFIWSVFLGQSLVFAFTLGIGVLVIACPHALGLAIPTVSTIATGLAVKNGIFIKDLGKLEIMKDITTVVFDKTGTLTKGELGVSDIIVSSNLKISDVNQLSDEQKNLIQKTASIEAHSTHVIARAIVDTAIVNNINLKEVSGIETSPGKGIQGKLNRNVYYIGNIDYIQEKIKIPHPLENKYKELSQDGKTAIMVSQNNQIIGIIGLADKIKEESKEAIEKIQSLGKKTVMLTGDNELVAKAVAKMLHIDTYYSRVMPENKVDHIRTLQENGEKVMMVGDGVNDAPALTQADVGVAIGAGTDVAVEAGDVVLIKNNPMDIWKLFRLSEKVYRKMKQNLIWAFGYNIIAIPLAAGIFIPFGFKLTPAIGALFMSFSSILVLMNALTLKFQPIGEKIKTYEQR